MERATQSLVSNVGQLMANEFWLLRAVGSEVGELRDELATMNAVLRMQSETEDGAVDHFIREWMKQVRELAYDADDCVDLYILRIKRRPSDGFLVRSKRLLATLFPRRLLAGSIRTLRARAIAISERHARYSASCQALRPSASFAPVPAVWAESAQALRPPDTDDPDQFVGIQEQAKTLVAMMEKEKDDKLQVFSIAGFGGLGKTTLAMEVCRQLEAKFDRQAQVSVSQAFDGGNDLRALLKRVLEQIVTVKSKNEKVTEEEEKQDSVGDIDGMDVEKLTSTLKEQLKDKRYLIVIDDVWTIAAWAAILSKLPKTTCGSRIIVTTRIDSVAKECSGGSVGKYYSIKPLNLEDSEKLFIRRAFGPKSTSCPGELKAAMDNILKKCNGLPLAIVSIGSLLASYSSPESSHMRETICRSIGAQMESNPTLVGMRKIITLSFNYLPHDLKRCMMYLCIFPEDYQISKDRLLRRWIAEGLIPEKRGLTLMETAEAYFNELVNRSMIDQAGCIVTYYNRVDVCQVHDMMLEVMVSKSLEANFVSLVGVQYEGMSYDIVRRLSVHDSENGGKYSQSERTATGRGMVNIIEGMNVQHVRSLTTFQYEGHKLLLDQLGKFKLLRVLDLEDCKDLLNKHLRYICKMYLLKFLSLRGTDISLLPPEVCNLE
ncbi:disease resistance protein Pik-2-like isoform X1 [Triticum urartu]|nr:disease resistance protein Pik-2-like isoform X1 [Triticum urartu]